MQLSMAVYCGDFPSRDFDVYFVKASSKVCILKGASAKQMNVLLFQFTTVSFWSVS